jgi:hypothetical protein
MSGLLGAWRSFLKRCHTVRNHFPRCFGANERLLTDLSSCIFVDTPQRDAMNGSFEFATERGAKFTAKQQTKTMYCDVRRQEVFAS